MLNRRFLLALSALLMLSPSVQAATFDQAAFAAAQAAGRPILIEVSAPWCPICKTQRPIIGALAQQAKFKDLVIFEIDFDTQKDLLRVFNARVQSTLIAFKGKEEVGRSVGETQPEWIESFLEKTL